MAYKKILLALDADDPGSWDRSWLAADALAETFHAQLSLCSVLPGMAVLASGDSWPIAYQERLAELRSKLQSIASATGHGGVAAEVAGGTICSGILDIARRGGADLIVLKSDAPGIRDRLLPAHAVRVARRANCSVLIVRETPETP